MEREMWECERSSRIALRGLETHHLPPSGLSLGCLVAEPGNLFASGARYEA
ncbi:unnamed protein product, partial [marine sediment metagenome]